MVEASFRIGNRRRRPREFDVLLINAPVPAWSRYFDSSGVILKSTLAALAGAARRPCSGGCPRGPVDFPVQPDQLPRSCRYAQPDPRVGEAALAGQAPASTRATWRKPNRFLSDVRYVVGAVVVPPGAPISA